ncbi:MAG: hypothetical protein KDD04_02790, partial [Sinomicrobium sp.]|nr:hypothetical protein [Sinomicrobium sp.]
AQKEALLPPYDRAILALKKLDESRYLIQSEYKAYYSRLTDIVRAYLEEEVNVAALESTTNELIAKLEMLKDSETLKINNDTIKQFHNILQTADLVKFARSRPETRLAEQHRTLMEQIVGDIKQALPEPTEEALLKNEAYLTGLAQKKRRKRTLRIAIAGAAVVVLIAAGAVWYYGVDTVKDTLIGHPTKTLLEGEWVASEYGYPPVYIETPEVLKRAPSPDVPEALKTAITNRQTFSYGELTANFYIFLSAATYQKKAETDMQQAIDAAIAAMEAQGAKNIIVKQDDLATQTGKEGVKVYGSMEVPEPGSGKLVSDEYVLLNFAQNGGFQQIMIIHRSNDRYAGKIVDRIINAIDFKAGT